MIEFSGTEGEKKSPILQVLTGDLIRPNGGWKGQKGLFSFFEIFIIKYWFSRSSFYCKQRNSVSWWIETDFKNFFSTNFCVIKKIIMNLKAFALLNFCFLLLFRRFRDCDSGAVDPTRAREITSCSDYPTMLTNTEPSTCK